MSWPCSLYRMCSFATTSWHQSGPTNLLLATHWGVHDFLAHGLFDGAYGLVARPIANRLLKLRVELADVKAMAPLHFFYRIVELFLQPMFLKCRTNKRRLTLVIKMGRKVAQTLSQDALKSYKMDKFCTIGRILSINDLLFSLGSSLALLLVFLVD